MDEPSEPKPTALTTLGRIGAVHGVKGWVRLISFTDPVENILNFKRFYLAPKEASMTGRPQQIEIDDSRTQGKHLVAHIKGCDDREEARIFTGCELKVETSALPKLAKDEFYWYQLEGLAVKNEQGVHLGVVHHLVETGANDVLVVREETAKEERLIPFVRGQVVKQVDLEKKEIRVDWEKDY